MSRFDKLSLTIVVCLKDGSVQVLADMDMGTVDDEPIKNSNNLVEAFRTVCNHYKHEYKQMVASPTTISHPAKYQWKVIDGREYSQL